MTLELKPVPRAANALRESIGEVGRIEKQEARSWLAELDPELSAGSLNFVIGYGLSPQRNWWHEDAEGFLVNGPKPGSKAALASEETAGTISDAVKKLVSIDPSTMSEPRDQLYTIAMNLGIPERAAKACAVNCFGAHEMFDPDEAWKGIVQSAELSPSQKRRLWSNWCGWAGLKVPEALAAKVETYYTALTPTGAGKLSIPISGRRFIAVKGEVMQVDADDPSGMSFTEALRVADQQLQKAKDTSSVPASAPAESPTVAAMITVLGDLATAALTPRTDPAAANSTTEIFKLMIESARSDSVNALALMKQDLDHRLENEARDRRAAEERSNAILLKLTDIIDRQGQPKNPFTMLDEVLPGIGARLLENLLNPPKQEGAFKVTIGDHEGNMTLDEYERFSQIQSKREVIQMVRQRLPEFIEMGKDFALATRRAGLPLPEKQPTAPSDGPYNFFCVQCLKVLFLAEGVQEFTCPHCGALQSVAGEVMAASEPESMPAPMEDAPLDRADPQVEREQVEPESELPVQPVLEAGAARD